MGDIRLVAERLRSKFMVFEGSSASQWIGIVRRSLGGPGAESVAAQSRMLGNGLLVLVDRCRD